MNKLKDNKKRAKNITLVFWILLALTVITIIVDFLQLMMLSNGNLDDASIASNDLRISIIGILYLITYILAAIFFIQWFRRAYYNLHQIEGSRLLFTEGWAAGYWFIPILNYFRPFQIMQEIWDKTQKYGRPGEGIKPKQIMNIWWGFYVVGRLLQSASTRIFGYDPDLESLKAATIFEIIAFSFDIIALLAALKMIKETSEFETDLFNSNREIDISEHLLDEAII